MLWTYFVQHDVLLVESWLFFPDLRRALELTGRFLKKHVHSFECPGSGNEPPSFGRLTSLIRGRSKREGKNQEARPGKKAICLI